MGKARDGKKGADGQNTVALKVADIRGGRLIVDRSHLCQNCSETDRDAASYLAGLADGIRRYAWSEGSVQYVGARLKTRTPLRLEEALAQAGCLDDDQREKPEGGDDRGTD